MQKTPVDIDLLKHFNVPLPRYTSYPTALSFNDVDGQQVWDHALADDTSDRALSLYFHMPFCRSLCWYCACSKVITRKQHVSRDYLDRLFKELEARKDVMHGRKVEQLHLGGGTPTFFLPQELLDLGNTVREHLDVAEDAEFAVEIDPRELTLEHVQALAAAGFNRASLGVQDHDPAVQELIHRVQPYEVTEQAVRWLRDAGIGSINFDLIYGLPLQTPDSFSRTIDDVIELSPDRLAVYSYAHVPWAAPAQKLLEERASLPDPDDKIRLFLLAVEKLLDAGYVYIGMDHFAKPDDELAVALRNDTLRRNFMGYSTHRGTDIHAFGVTAISQTRDMYFQNAKDLAQWESAVDAGESTILRGVTLTTEDLARREIIMALMCQSHVRWPNLEKVTGVRDFEQRFASEISELAAYENDGLLVVHDHGIDVTDKGRFFVRNIASTFDAYRRNQSGFSKAI